MMGMILQQYWLITTLVILTILLGGATNFVQADEPLFNTIFFSPAALTTPPVITVAQRDLIDRTVTCQDRFISHPLDHVTVVAGNEVHLFDSNGSGLAINDLDNDGNLDIVLANLAGPNTILWNEGQLTFRKETLSQDNTGAVNIVDVDGDGWLDMVFSHPLNVRPTLWHNNGLANKLGFSQMSQFKIKNPYTMAWADLDGDNDLDLVAATYDAELKKTEDRPDTFGGGGIIYYQNQEEQFTPTYLAYTAQTLALLLADLNEDGHLDILAGNDFHLPDQVWLRQTDGWQEAQLFTATTQNTMSFDAGDINNDGQVEIFATDMKPYTSDSETLAAWEPLMKKMHEQEPLEGDPQIMENVLQVRDEQGHFQNQAAASGLAATGWSWSAKWGQ